MSRIIGIETEYGIMAPPGMTAMLASALVVGAYRDTGGPWAAWDYASEDPLADARGFHLQRAAADPSLLTDQPVNLPRLGQARPSAIVIVNGARLYVDHAHPEYAAPECASARAAALWDVAGEVIMLAASQAAPVPIALYKNNTDGKGASYGTHENYLVDRSVPFDQLVAFMTPFLVTRQILTGSGRVGLGQRSQTPGFQLSQRADFIEAEVGLETTLRRPIINTRDEPHADPSRWRRLHVIVGDATCLAISTYLRLGLTSLALTALESGHWDQAWLRSVTLARPVEAFSQVSRDLSLTYELSMADGGRRTAIDIQRQYLALVRAVAGSAPDVETTDLLARWSGLLDALAVLAGGGAGVGKSPRAGGIGGAIETRAVSGTRGVGADQTRGALEADQTGGVPEANQARGVPDADLDQDSALTAAASQIEWLAKYRLLDALRQRSGSDWSDPRLAAADLQWTDLRPAKSLAARLAASGTIEALFTESEITAAVTTPPTNTRAATRGQAVAQGRALTANWDTITIKDGPQARRLNLPNPQAPAASLSNSAIEGWVR